MCVYASLFCVSMLYCSWIWTHWPLFSLKKVIFPFLMPVAIRRLKSPVFRTYLREAGRRIVGFLPFPRVLGLCERQSATFWNWTQIGQVHFQLLGKRFLYVISASFTLQAPTFYAVLYIKMIMNLNLCFWCRYYASFWAANNVSFLLTGKEQQR